MEKVIKMRKEYDFSNAQKNPYASRLKRQVTLRIDEGTVGYFKGLAEEMGIPYQTLIASIIHRYVSGRLSDRHVHA